MILLTLVDSHFRCMEIVFNHTRKSQNCGESSSSSLKIELLNGHDIDTKEEDAETNQDSYRDAGHSRIITKTHLNVFLHRPIKTRSKDSSFYVTKLGSNYSAQCPCNRADVVEPNPPRRNVLQSDQMTNWLINDVCTPWLS